MRDATRALQISNRFAQEILVAHRSRINRRYDFARPPLAVALPAFVPRQGYRGIIPLQCLLDIARGVM
jgi:hypothetical protein